MLTPADWQPFIPFVVAALPLIANLAAYFGNRSLHRVSKLAAIRRDLTDSSAAAPLDELLTLELEALCKRRVANMRREFRPGNLAALIVVSAMAALIVWGLISWASVAGGWAWLPWLLAIGVAIFSLALGTAGALTVWIDPEVEAKQAEARARRRDARRASKRRKR